MKIIGLSPDRIHVIGNAVDASFYPVRDAWLLANVRERYGIAPRFVLYFGGFDMRKNVPRIIEAYGHLPEAVRRGRDWMKTPECGRTSAPLPRCYA